MGMADDPEGFDDAVADAECDPRVILALNVVLSSAFAWVVVWALSMLYIRRLLRRQRRHAGRRPRHAELMAVVLSRLRPVPRR